MDAEAEKQLERELFGDSPSPPHSNTSQSGDDADATRDAALDGAVDNMSDELK